MIKCAFCRKKAQARVDLGGSLVPVCAKHFGNHKAVTPVHPQTKKEVAGIQSMINIEEKAGLTPVLD
ncbi:MAG: hypothetical protein PHQ22_10280 [Sulfuricurvum sp.]|nr:hypothetical protein [Sulfuricurvum sp.]